MKVRLSNLNTLFVVFVLSVLVPSLPLLLWLEQIRPGSAVRNALLALFFASAIAFTAYRLGAKYSSSTQKMQNRIAEQHRVVEAIYETTSSGYVTLSEKGRPIDCNPAMLEMLGVKDKRTLLGKFLNFMPSLQPDGERSEDKYFFLIDRTLETGSVRFEWMFSDVEKKQVPCNILLKLIRVNRRRILVASIQDLRYQYRVREALARQREQLQDILDSTPVVLGIVADGIVYDINGNGVELLGLSPGEHMSAVYADESDEALIRRRLANGERVNNYPLKVKGKDEHVLDTLVTFVPFRYERKKAFLMWLVDVSELVHARLEAEEGTRAKSDFLARMSHEIRSPMNAVLGMSHLCLQTELTERQKHYLHKIQTAAKTLLSLINDILDFSKVEAGKLTLENAPFRLSESLTSLKDLIAFRAEQKGILFEIEIDPQVPNCLEGDSLRLNQILVNLCDNALKFTERGKIALRIRSEKTVYKKGDRARLFFEVEDTGVGMPSEKASVIFSPFVQSDRSITRKYGGTGLGLTICKHLVEGMNGTIEAWSEVDRGTIMRFSIEVSVTDDLSVKEQKVEVLSPTDLPINCRVRANVLLVEDNADNQEIAVALLKQSGVEVAVASNGAEAVEAIKSNRYDIVFMDVQMPVLDGLEATRQIRRLRGCSADELPIIAMTAHAMKGDHEKSLNAGMNDHITKPIDPALLYQTLTAHLKPERIVPLSPSERTMGAGASSTLFTAPVPELRADVGLKNVNNNADLYRSLLRKFPSQHGNTAAMLQEALVMLNVEVAERLVHTVKGIAGTLGMSPLSESARDLEAAIRENRPWEDLLFHFSARLHAMTGALELAFAEEAKQGENQAMKSLSAEECSELKNILLVLPDLLKADLMEAWRSISRAVSVLDQTPFEERCNALSMAVLECDDVKAQEIARELMCSLNLE